MMTPGWLGHHYWLPVDVHAQNGNGTRDSHFLFLVSDFDLSYNANTIKLPEEVKMTVLNQCCPICDSGIQ